MQEPVDFLPGRISPPASTVPGKTFLHGAGILPVYVRCSKQPISSIWTALAFHASTHRDPGPRSERWGRWGSTLPSYPNRGLTQQIFSAAYEPNGAVQ